MDDRFLDQLRSPPPAVTAILVGYQRKMERLLLEMARLPGLSSWQGSRSLPLVLLRSFAKVLRLQDESSRFFLGHLRRCGYNASCKVGCAHCCLKMPCGVGAMELVFLYHGIWCQGDFAKTARRFLERDQCWSRICSRRRFAAGAAAPVPDLLGLLNDYEGLLQPCPLLDDGLCRGYRYRPFACRMHFSLSPPHWCRPDHFQHHYAVCFSLEPGERVYAALDKLDQRFGLERREPLTEAMLDLTVNVMSFQPLRWSR